MAMNITDLEQETRDLDWFAIDQAGHVAHFATGGRGFLPVVVTQSASDRDQLVAYFRQLPCERSDAAMTNAGDVEVASGADLTDFTAMARRGLFSYDFASGRTRPAGYNLICHPTTKPLQTEELPSEICQLLEPVSIARNFAASNTINVADFAD